MSPAVFVDALRAVRAQLDAVEDAGIGLVRFESKWQVIVPEDRATWPPLFKPVLVSQSGDEPEIAAFDTEDVDRLRIHYKNWEGKVYAGWSFLVFPPPPRSPRGAQ